MKPLRAAITAVHGWVPEFVLDNKKIMEMVDTNDEWIQSRTGIAERRILRDKTKASSDLGAEAAMGLLKKKNLDPLEIDLLICATATPDMLFPATANIICEKIGARNAFSYDISAACSGFLYSLSTGARFIESGKYKKALIVGADKMSSIVDYSDRSTCILFGDGGGAVLLEPNTEGFGMLDEILKSDGSGCSYLHQKGGGSLNPASHETVDKKWHYIYQEGQSVFKFAVKGMADISAEIMEKNKLTADDIAYLVPHQANKRIISATAKRMGISMDKVMMNIQRYGNTTNATIPLCLWEWENKLKKGDNLIVSAFGGGFTWGAIWVKWAY